MHHDINLEPIAIAYKIGTLRVEWRRGNLWAVTHPRDRTCFSKDGTWEREPAPKARTEEFIQRTRYPLQEAITLAQTHQPEATTNDPQPQMAPESINDQHTPTQDS